MPTHSTSALTWIARVNAERPKKGGVLWKEKSRFASRFRSWILMLSKFHHIVSINLDRPCRLWSFDTRCIYFGFDFCLVIALWVLVAAWLRLNGIPTRGWRMMRRIQQRWDRGTVCQNWKIQSKPWYFRKTCASHGICQNMRHHVIWSGHANTLSDIHLLCPMSKRMVPPELTKHRPDRGTKSLVHGSPRATSTTGRTSKVIRKFLSWRAVDEKTQALECTMTYPWQPFR